jgi:ABC-type glycerol-3-phosphate transport system permease component
VAGSFSFRPRSLFPFVAGCLLALPFVFPALWVLMASLSTNNAITLDALRPPSELHFENYAHAWNEGQIGRFVGNSLIVSTASAVLIAIAATMLGYALGRLEFPGRRLVLLVVISAIALPVFAYVIPLTRTVRALHLPDARLAVILATTATFLPVPTLLMRSFFQTLPEELADAARVEGASEWQVFHHIMAPLARPGILTALIFAFVWAWNDVLLPVVFLQSPDQFTIPYGIAALRPADFRQDYVSVFAASIISTAPMVIIWMFLQRRFIAGLTLGASKG